MRDTDRRRLDIVEYWPALLGWGRIGIAERLEVHGMAWLLGGTVGAKYQLVGHGRNTGPAVSPVSARRRAGDSARSFAPGRR